MWLSGNHKEDVGLVEVDDLGRRLEVEEHVAVAEHRALRVRRGPRGVDDGRQVVAVDRLPSSCHRRRSCVQVGAGHDVVEGERAAGSLPLGSMLTTCSSVGHSARIASIFAACCAFSTTTSFAPTLLIMNAACPPPTADRSAGHRPERQRREIATVHSGRVRPRIADAVAVGDAEVLEPERHRGDPVPHLAVRPARPAALSSPSARRPSALPAHRLAIGVALDRPVDEVDHVPRLLLGPDRERLDLGRLHQPSAGAGRHRSSFPPRARQASWRTVSRSPCATMSRWIWFVPS